MVMGLGDVYLGAPCAVPVDPRHRLVVPKYNPARTYTPEGELQSYSGTAHEHHVAVSGAHTGSMEGVVGLEWLALEGMDAPTH